LRAEEAHGVGEREVAKSSRVISCSSTNSQASGRTMRMSGISKWPTSELKIALIRAPNGLSLLNATAFIRSSGSQPKKNGFA
jgi:hypothetical protein